MIGISSRIKQGENERLTCLQAVQAPARMHIESKSFSRQDHFDRSNDPVHSDEPIHYRLAFHVCYEISCCTVK